MTKTSRFTRRLGVFTAIAVLTIGALGAFALRELAVWDDMAGRLARESLEASLDGIFHSSLTRAVSEAVSFAATGNARYAREATDALLYAQSAMGQLRRLGAERTASGQAEETRKLRQDQEELLSRVRRSVTQALRAGSGPEPPLAERLEQIYAPEENADHVWLALVAWHDNERRALNHSLREQRLRVLLAGSATGIATLAWVLLLNVLVGRHLLAPVERLTRLAERIAEGDLDATPFPAAAAEVAALQGALVRIQDGLRLRPPDSVTGRPDTAAGEAAAPVAPAGPPETAPEGTPDRPPGPKRALFLAADPAERDLTRAMLEHCGLTVTLAEEAAVAEAALGGGAFDLIVIDLPAPDPVAASLATWCEDRSGDRRIPIIVLCGDGPSSATPPWFVSGLDAQIKRPFSFFDLHAALTRGRDAS